jgi:acetyl coenzyme A synthetase (ADP forming)-like protein
MSTLDPEASPVDTVLRDGSTVRIRAARPDDRVRVEEYLIDLSPESRRLRFLSPSVDVGKVAATAVDVTPHEHVTLLALSGGEHGVVVGGAQYFRIEGTARAEMSVSVADRFQGRGLGSILIGRLAEVGRDQGIEAFVADVLPENHRMIAVFRESGFAPQIRALPGEIEVTIPTLLTEDAARHFEEREIHASANAVRSFLAPETVAVVGASRDPVSIGGRLFRNLLDSNFHGVVYPVNPSAAAVHGVAAFSSVLEVPGSIDVAFIVVPAARVTGVARQCAEKGVHGLIVISAGFAEIGGDGPGMQRELLEICHASGMRLIGPNCMGIINTDPAISLNGTFASSKPMEGRVGFLSQSGAVGLAVMDQTSRLGLGLSGFVSVGNKADISGNDLLSYWETDDRTDVLLLYLESFGNPQRFAHLARRIGKRKPIVAVKSGRSAAGMRAAASHTAAMLASDTALDTLFRQNGVIRTDTLEEMLDVATFLAHQPAPKGSRVGIVTNAGGLAVQCADAAEARGLTVPVFSAATQAELARSLPPEAASANPVDMIASAEGADYAKAITLVARSGEVDALVVIYIPPLASQTAEIARHIAEAVDALRGEIPVIAAFMTARGVPDELRSGSVRIPSYAFPEQAAIALARAASYGAWRERPEGRVRRFSDIREDEAAGILSEALSRGAGWLEPSEVEHLLRCYGVGMARTERTADAETAGNAADRLGGSVVLKAIGPLHKTDVGAVRLHLRGPVEVSEAAADMSERLAANDIFVEGFLVQEQIEEGVEVLVGVAADPRFGPVVACGAGGIAAELLKDVAVRVTPLTVEDAHDMIRELSTFPLLDGYRGAPKADVAALEDVVLRIGAMAQAHPEIVEMDCNPVMVLPRGAVVVDVRARIETGIHPTTS